MRYFDSNATMPLCAEAKAVWEEASENLWMNPSSPYRAAARIKTRLEDARSHLASLLGVNSARVVFNSGATEGNNAIFAYWSATLPVSARIGISPTEHPSVIESAKYYFGERIEWLALNASGAVAIEAIDFKAMDAISVMAANHETGILNPWQDIANAARNAGVLYHCDASQWVGKGRLNKIGDCGYVTACSHKFGGPQGVGFWLLPEVENNFISLYGGAQESRRRAGTENVSSILAMVAALKAVKFGKVDGRDSLIAELPEFECVGLDAPRLWNTAFLIAPKFASSRWIRALEVRGFLVGSGAACASGKAGPSTVLKAMGYSPSAMSRTLRLSANSETTLKDWADLAKAIRIVYNQLESEAAAQSLTTVIDL